MPVLWEGGDRQKYDEAPPPVLQGVGPRGGRPWSAARERVLGEAGIDWTEVEHLTSDRKAWMEKVEERMKYLNRGRGHPWCPRLSGLVFSQSCRVWDLRGVPKAVSSERPG